MIHLVTFQCQIRSRRSCLELGADPLKIAAAHVCANPSQACMGREPSHHIFLAIIRLDKNYWKNVKSGQPQFASGTIINHCYQTRNNFFADY